MTNPILMLNDFCFLKIFEYLSLHDLANVKEAFKCLDAVTDMAFKRTTDGILYFHGLPKYCGLYDPEGSKQIIKQFGSSVHTLSIAGVSVQVTNWKEIFSTINEHCKEKLTNLSLIGKNVTFITKADVVLIIDILKKLETIKLDAWDAHSTEYLEILCYCGNVKSIELGNRIDSDLHKTIFLNNQNLLKLKWCGGLKDSDTKKIINNLMNVQLEQMSIRLPNEYFKESFADLTSLKHLQILILSTHLYDRDIAALGRMNNLKIINLDTCFLRVDSPFKSLLVLCGNKSLDHLLFSCSLSYVGCNERFDRIDTTNFLQIIEKRKALTTEKCFHLTLKHNVYTASLEAIPFELLEANKETIKVVDRKCWDINYKYNNSH